MYFPSIARVSSPTHSVAFAHPPPGIPNVQDPNRKHDRRKLQTPKPHLGRTQAAHNPLRRLGEAKTGPQINQQRRGHEGGHERAQPLPLAHRFPSPVEEHKQQDEEDQVREHLDGQAGQEDVVGRGRVAAVAFGAAYQGGAGDLDRRRDDVGHDENPQDRFRGERGVGAAQGADERAEDRVDGRGEEDGRDDDEEVLQHEVDDVVGVAFGGEGAGDVADYFEDGADWEGAEEVGAVAEELERVGYCGEREEDCAEEGEGEGGRVALLVSVFRHWALWFGEMGSRRGRGGEPVNNQRRILRSVRVREVRVDVVFTWVRHDVLVSAFRLPLFDIRCTEGGTVECVNKQHDLSNRKHFLECCSRKYKTTE